MANEFRVEVASAQITGLRETQQDVVEVHPDFAIVADGQPGAKLAAAQAAKFVRETLRDPRRTLPHGVDASWPPLLRMLVGGVLLANVELYRQNILAHNGDRSKYMLTTATAAAVDAEAGKLYIAHVGDTRAYILRALENSLTQLTVDHTIFLPSMRDDPPTTRRRKWLTRSVGSSASVAADYKIEDIDAGDIVLLCSDGVHHALPTALMHELLTGPGELGSRARRLITAAAVSSTSGDNASVALIRLLGRLA